MNLEQRITRIDRYKLALAEVDAIIEASDISEQEKISLKFREFIKQKKSKDYMFNIDSNKKLVEQDVMQETKIILSLIYRSYFCTEEERLILQQKDMEAKEKAEIELREKYNPDNIFKNVTISDEENNESVSQEMSLIECNSIPWYKKILDKIKSIFNK